MAWCLVVAKLLSEPIMVSLLAHICPNELSENDIKSGRFGFRPQTAEMKLIIYASIGWFSRKKRSIQNKEIFLVFSYVVAITPGNMLLLDFLEYKNWKNKFGNCHGCASVWGA